MKQLKLPLDTRKKICSPTEMFNLIRDGDIRLTKFREWLNSLRDKDALKHYKLGLITGYNKGLKAGRDSLIRSNY